MRWAADFWEAGLPINKVTWQQVGHVADPGRYMFRFGWLTIVPDDLAVWKQFPDASFTLVQTLAPPLVAEAVSAEMPPVEPDEFHLGAFELRLNEEPHEDLAQPADERQMEDQSSV
jgi:hypothetical protein